MKLQIINIAHHRNGVGGAPFDAALFKDHGPQGSLKVGILFEQPGRCAILDVAKLATGDIAFGSNSWRGDNYEPSLREAIKSHLQASEDTLRKPRCRQEATTTQDNDVRAERCEQAMSAYSGDDSITNLVDFLADAMHWCDYTGQAFHTTLAQACRHYIHELNDEQTGERRKP